MKLTDRQIKNLKPKRDRYEVWEGRGFGIRVFPTGKKSWVFMYRFEGRARRITFGNYPQISVAEAHAAHGKALTDLEKSIDPGSNLVSHNKEHRHAPTVAVLAKEYLDKWAKPRKRSWQEDERMINKDVLPLLGNRKAKDVIKRDILFLLDRVAGRGASIAANRTLAVTRRMFNFAMERDMIESTPCYAIKAPSKENRRDRVLSEDEIRAFWHGLDNAKMLEISKLALKLQLVTGQRKGEIINAEWRDFDFQNGWWTISASKAKNNNLHRVPLSQLALEILEEVKILSNGSNWLFPSPKGNTHIIPTAVRFMR